MKYLCCLLISFSFITSTWAQRQENKIGWIDEGLSQQEKASVNDYLSKLPGFSYQPLSFGQLSNGYLQKHHINQIWWFRDTTAEPNAKETAAGIVLKRFVKSGGHLILSMEAVCLLNNWGIEENKIEIKTDSVIDEGFGRPCGFHAFESHPLFQGLHGGAYTWKAKVDHQLRKLGFFGGDLPDTSIAKVIGIGWTYITFHEDEKLVWEYHLGKGSIIAIGAYTYFSQPNFNRQQLYRFYNNVFNYAAGNIKNIAAEYWSYAKPQVIAGQQSFTAMPPPPATNWQLPAFTLQLHRKQATKSFVDVVGRRMLIMGKEQGGIEEIWSHPFMAFRDIQTGVQLKGEDSVIWLNEREPAITVSPEMIVRKYPIANDTLSEIITVDFDQPVAVVHYQWNNKRFAKIWLKYTSNLRMMWPYSDTASPLMHYQWSPALNAAIINDPHTGHVSLMAFSHQPDDYSLGQFSDFKIKNSKIEGAKTTLLQVSGLFSFNAKELQGKFNAYLLAGTDGLAKTTDLYNQTSAGLNKLYHRSSDYYNNLLKTQLMITTPDTAFNEGYRWAMVRADQFLQETPDLGTSMMAGFGTTARGWNGRQKVSGRPGYAWYFGRDGEWSAIALDAMGAFDKTKKVLELLAKYQAVNGKIFHELTSSGAVHYDAADATPLFVVLAAHYLHYSGDTTFIRRLWPSVQRAMAFCYSTDTDGDGLIENTNVGHGWIEGGPLFGTHTEFYLAGSWAAALDAAAYMSAELHQNNWQRQYAKDAMKVKQLIDQDFWSDKQQHFYNGKMLDGSYMKDATVLTAVPIYFNTVTDKRKAQETTASFADSRFSTDWGMRIIPEDNPNYNPGAYHAGMVWPLFSGYAALAEYKTGRYINGFTHMMNNTLQYDHWALGSIEETLSGKSYQPAGVCSQQCWSETMAIQPAIEGMLGLRPDALSHTLHLSPAFPWNWNKAEVDNIKIGNNKLRMQMSHSLGHYEYTFNKATKGAVKLDFAAILPPGSAIKKISVNGNATNYNSLKENEGLRINFPELQIKESTKIIIDYTNGIGVLPKVYDPEPGATNTGVKIINQHWDNNYYSLEVEGIPGKQYRLKLYADQALDKIEHGGLRKLTNNIYEISFRIPDSKEEYGTLNLVIRQ